MEWSVLTDNCLIIACSMIPIEFGAGSIQTLNRDRKGKSIIRTIMCFESDFSPSVGAS
jgi:hypothetical protein